ncbi:MAG: TRAM domain-containing protein [Actinomycetota bacterium]|nr:TRAM domain-containing protein [Actinomycetota bacterium]
MLCVRLLSMLACSYGGYEIAILLNENYISGSAYQILAIIIGIILGLLVGYVLGGVIGRATADVLAGMGSTISRIPAGEIILGAFGTLLGFLLALFPSIVLFRFGYPGCIASIALLLLLGFAGAQVGLVKKSELSKILRISSVPGVEMAGSTGRILDTSVIIDGRIVEIAKSGFFDGTVVVPRFVLSELQGIADSSDTLKRNRGRRGLEVLNALQRLPNVDVQVRDEDFPELMSVDSKLVAMSKITGMPLVTNDFNLNRIAEFQQISVLNINQLASALKPVVLPGEEMTIRIIREGKEPGQGVGYLDDGTMVVVEHGRSKIGNDVAVTVTNVRQTPAGKMIFSELRSKNEHLEE